MSDDLVYTLSHAGEQIERALAGGYDVAAFNLYVDASRQEVELVAAGDGTEWHRSVQERTQFHDPRFAASSDEVKTDPPLLRNAFGDVIGREPS
jgi:hypothetical protein